MFSYNWSSPIRATQAKRRWSLRRKEKAENASLFYFNIAKVECGRKKFYIKEVHINYMNCNF